MYINQKNKKRRLSKRALLTLSGVGLVILVLIVGLVLLLTRSPEVADTILPLPFSGSDTYFTIGDTIVYAQQDLLTCMDENLEVVWQVRLFAEDLDFASSDELIAIIGPDIIQVIDKDGKFVCQTKTDGVIRSVRVCDNKFAACVHHQEDEAAPSYIVVFDLSAASLYQTEVTGRYILEYGFDNESDQLFILELDVSGAAPVSRISTFRPETQSMTGIKELKDQLISHLFIQNGSVYAVGTNQLTIKATRSENDREIMIYGWVLEDIRFSTTPSFVFVPQQSAAGSIDTTRIIDASGSESTINLPPDVFRIIETQERIYCFAHDRIFVYTDGGGYLRTHMLPFEIDSVMKATSNAVLITAGEQVYLLPLP